MRWRQNIWVLVLFLLAGGLLGGVLGEILRAVSPEGPVRDLFIQGFEIGLTPPLTLDLHLVTLTFGFTLRANLLTLLGALLGLYLYRYL